MAFMTLPPGNSTLQIEASVGLPEGRFDKNTRFDFAGFDRPLVRSIARFDESKFAFRFLNLIFESVFNYSQPFATLNVQYLDLTPGAFTAVVPWDIPGFSTSIQITEQTLKRLREFGVKGERVGAIANMKVKTFDTSNDFYKAVYKALSAIESTLTPWDIDGLGGAEQVTTETLTRLRNFGIVDTQIAVIGTLIGQTFESVADFYKALFEALGIDNQLFSRNQWLDDLLKICLREATQTDKYAQYDISPRNQIAAIISRVKAAGVYSEVSFEKRFGEHQQLGEALTLRTQFIREEQDLVDGNFDFYSEERTEEKQNLVETLHLSGVFNYTFFNSLNGFA